MIGTTEISKAVCFLTFALIWFSSVLFNLKIHGVWRTEKYAEMVNDKLKQFHSVLKFKYFNFETDDNFQAMPKVEMLTGI